MGAGTQEAAARRSATITHPERLLKVQSAAAEEDPRFAAQCGPVAVLSGRR
jgi:hypothetical protein